MEGVHILDSYWVSKLRGSKERDVLSSSPAAMSGFLSGVTTSLLIEGVSAHLLNLLPALYNLFPTFSYPGWLCCGFLFFIYYCS